MIDRKEIGARIIALRKASGQSQRAVAEASGLSRPGLANIEAGRQGLPLDTLDSIARALGVKVVDLLGESPSPTAALAVLAQAVGSQRELTRLMAEAAEILHDLSAESERFERLLGQLGGAS
jgi:transcriptional regulator with XRE-family HTH domain